VPVDVAVEEPWAGVVGVESDRDVIGFVRVRVADAHDVAHDGVDVIVRLGTCAPDHVECVSVQVDRVLCVRVRVRRMIPSGIRNAGGKLQLTGPPRAPAGMLISTLLCAARP
jgi:hypothetical protein